MKKTKIKLDDMERRILVKLLYEKRNELIREGRYTDGLRKISVYFRTLFTAQTTQSIKMLNTHIKLSMVEIG